MASWKKIILLAGSMLIGLYILFQIGYYATSPPRFCGSCHELENYVSSWRASAHKDINCLECHQPSGELGKLHAKARGLNYVFQHFSGDYTVPTGAQVFENNCIQCHLGDDERYLETVRMKNTALISHYDIIKQSRSCLECHRETGHEVDLYLTPELKGLK